MGRGFPSTSIPVGISQAILNPSKASSFKISSLVFLSSSLLSPAPNIASTIISASLTSETISTPRPLYPI